MEGGRSNNEVTRILEVMTYLRGSRLLANSPCQYLRTKNENSTENVRTDVTNIRSFFLKLTSRVVRISPLNTLHA